MAASAWTPIPTAVTGILHGLDVYDAGLAFAAGEGNVILRRRAGSSLTLNAAPQQYTRTDGDLSDWSTAATTLIDAANAHTVQGAPPAATNLSAGLRARWWDERLFLALDVSDDLQQPQDHVVIALDGRDDNAAGGGDDHRISLYADGRVAGAAGMVSAVSPRAGGYRLEMAIPAAALGDDFHPGRTLGLNVGLFDDDGAGVESSLLWAAPNLEGSPDQFAAINLLAFGGNRRSLTALPAGATQLDGSLAEWSAGAARDPSAATADTVQGSAPAPVDLSAGLRARWWTDYLFLGVAVRDNSIGPGDLLYLAFDGDEDGRKGGPHDWDMRIDLAGGVSNGYQALVYTQITAEGYSAEVAVPVHMLGGSLGHGRSLGFNLALADDDNGDGLPESWLAWEGASAGGVFSDLGEMRLAAFSLDCSRAWPDTPACAIPRWISGILTRISAETTLEWRSANTGPSKKGVIWFDLSPLPAGSVVYQALLHLNVTQTNDRQLNVDVHRLLQPWQVAAATWMQAAANQPWQAPGAAGAEDRAATASARRWSWAWARSRLISARTCRRL